MPDIDSLIASAALPERTISHCVRGDLVAEVERLDRELASLASADQRLTGNQEARKVAEQIEAVREHMQTSSIEFTLRALGRRAFQKFQTEHAPRDGNLTDRAMGFNEETFMDDLVRQSIVAPKITDEQWDSLCDSMTAAQWSEFANVATSLNMEQVSVPFSRSASRILRTSDGT